MLEENAAWEKEESQKGDPTYWDLRNALNYQVDGVYDGYMMANKGKPERVCPEHSIDYRPFPSGKFNFPTMIVILVIGTVFLTTKQPLRRKMRPVTITAQLCFV